MNDQSKSGTQSVWKRDITPDIFIFRWLRHFSRWLFSWRGVRRMLIILAWIVTIIALIYGEENWRGRRAWNNYRESLNAQLDYNAFIPPTIPDDRNFAATPFVKAWFTDRTNTYHFDKDAYSAVHDAIRGYDPDRDEGHRQLMNLAAWGMAFDAARSGPLQSGSQFESDKLDPGSRAQGAAIVLQALKDDDAVFAELRQAALRPSSRYFIDYNLDDPWGILLPHLARIKSTCQRLQLKACAELAAGQSNQALDDVKLCLRMADSVRDEPFLISYLLRRVCVMIAIQPVWEGLVEHRWNDAQLQELQQLFQSYDFVSDLNRPLTAERAAGVLTGELLAKNKIRFNDLMSPRSSSPADAVGLGERLLPSGWIRLEQLNYCRLFQLQMDGTTDVAAKRVFPARVERNRRELERAFEPRTPLSAFVTRHQVLSIVLLPAVGDMFERAARGQVAVDHVVITCALERYRLANGQFPQTLDPLHPRFIAQLPHDVINGEMYHYRPNADGTFTLYSVGWNERDDHGTVQLGKGGVLWQEGDWVWTTPSR